METPSVIDRRRMIRHFTSQPLGEQTVQSLLEAATRAPSPHNRQPWRFAVVRGVARERLAQAMGRQLREDLRNDGLDEGVIEQDVNRSYLRITSAGACIVVCMSMQDMDIYPDARRNIAERWMAGQAVAAAIQNMLLRATEIGVGACWMCAPLFCPDIVVNTLRLPLDWEPQALVALGYPADVGKDRPRKPFGDVSKMIEM